MNTPKKTAFFPNVFRRGSGVLKLGEFQSSTPCDRGDFFHLGQKWAKKATPHGPMEMGNPQVGPQSKKKERAAKIRVEIFWDVWDGDAHILYLLLRFIFEKKGPIFFGLVYTKHLKKLGFMFFGGQKVNGGSFCQKQNPRNKSFKKHNKLTWDETSIWMYSCTGCFYFYFWWSHLITSKHHFSEVTWWCFLFCSVCYIMMYLELIIIHGFLTAIISSLLLVFCRFLIFEASTRPHSLQVEMSAKPSHFSNGSI